MQVNFRSILIYYIIRIHNSNKWMVSFSVEFTDFQKQNNHNDVTLKRDEFVDNNGSANSILPIIPWGHDLILHYLTQPVYGPISFTYVL